MKFLIGLITAILMSGVANAQHGNAPVGNLSLGIKAGVNLYNVQNNNNTGYDQKIGYNFGLLGHIHVGNQFAIQPEIVYSTQGAKIGNSPYDLNYINIPVMFQYMFDNGFRLQAGPQVGFLIAARSKNDNTTVNIKDDLKPVDLGVSIGASYVFRLRALVLMQDIISG